MISRPLANDPARDHVKLLLEKHGLRGRLIPESLRPTPDLLLSLPSNRALIEVKVKTDDTQFRSLVDSPAGTTATYKASPVENVLKDGWVQIRDYSERRDSDFTVIWLMAERIAALSISAAKSVLYGVRDLEVYTENGALKDMQCYFFHNSFFYRHKELDGVVLHDDNLKLCLNPYSTRAKSFRQSALAKLFQKEFHLVDPDVDEERGECFIADCDVDRNSTNDVVRYLKKKYRLQRVVIPQYVLVNCPAE